MAQAKEELKPDIFPLEDNVEMPQARGDVDFIEKLKRTLDVIKVGQSFVVPKSKSWKLGKIFKEEKYQHMKLITALIPPQKTFVRIKRVA